MTDWPRQGEADIAIQVEPYSPAFCLELFSPKQALVSKTYFNRKQIMSWSNLPGQEFSLLCSFSSLSRRGSLLVCFVYLTLSIFPTKGRLQKIKETLGALEDLKGLHGLLPVMADLVVVEESFFRGPLLSHQLPAPKVHCKGPLQFTSSLQPEGPVLRTSLSHTSRKNFQGEPWQRRSKLTLRNRLSPSDKIFELIPFFRQGEKDYHLNM